MKKQDRILFNITWYLIGIPSYIIYLVLFFCYKPIFREKRKDLD